MPSSTEAGAPPAARARTLGKVLTSWNRRIHFYLGLYLLLFLWLFAFTGLLLNHPLWTFADFWPNRQQLTTEVPIQPPPAGADLIRAQDIMRQAGVRGEIEWTRSRQDANRLDFRASRPGHIYEIKADLQMGRATIHQIDLNAWGVMHILHTFTGVRLADSKNQRDWSMTTLWVLCMDAVTIGLILMVLSSIYMWWSLKQKRWLGTLALGAGVLICGLFVIGLRWLT